MHTSDEEVAVDSGVPLVLGDFDLGGLVGVNDLSL